MCLLITAATVYGMSRACLFLQLHIFIYTFLRNSSLHTGIAMLELRVTINISVLKVCFVTVLCFVRLNWDKHAKKTANNCQALCVSRATSVSTAYKPCLSVHPRNTETNITAA